MYRILILSLILCSPSNTNAQIDIKIQISDSSQISVQASGEAETKNLENSNHRELFHITDELLQKALFTLTGLQTEVYLDSDNDVYKNYKKEAVKVLLKPNGTKILRVVKEEVILNKLTAFNHDVFEKSQNITIAGNVEDNITCVFKQEDVFPAEITHTIDVSGIGKRWSLKSTFGRDLSETEVVPIANASFVVNLGPKQNAKAILGATKLTVIIQIQYLAVLTGSVLAKFDSSYIWGYEHYDIKTVMNEAGMPHSVRLIEDMTIEVYTNCIIKLYGQNIYATDMSLCSFTVINATDVDEVNWSSTKLNKNLSTVLPNVLPYGNSALRNSMKSILLVISLIILIQ